MGIEVSDTYVQDIVRRELGPLGQEDRRDLGTLYNNDPTENVDASIDSTEVALATTPHKNPFRAVRHNELGILPRKSLKQRGRSFDQVFREGTFLQERYSECFCWFG